VRCRRRVDTTSTDASSCEIKDLYLYLYICRQADVVHSRGFAQEGALVYMSTGNGAVVAPAHDVPENQLEAHSYRKITIYSKKKGRRGFLLTAYKSQTPKIVDICLTENFACPCARTGSRSAASAPNTHSRCGRCHTRSS